MYFVPGNIVDSSVHVCMETKPVRMHFCVCACVRACIFVCMFVCRCIVAFGGGGGGEVSNQYFVPGKKCGQKGPCLYAGSGCGK